MNQIVTLAMNPVMDKSSSVDQVVAERKLYCTPPRFEPGGGGVNVSRAIKKLGGESRLYYPAGGLTGKRLQELLDEEGLNHRPFSIEGMNRESLVILEESTGQQYRFGMPGPTLQQKEWEPVLRELAAMEPAPEYVVASGSLPPGVPADFYARVTRVGKERGAKAIIDVSGEALEAALQEGVFLIKPNVREFRELVGEEIKEESQIKAEAKKMVQSGRCEVLVISLGAAGALVVSKDFAEHILPPTVPIVSKVGAGKQHGGRNRPEPGPGQAAQGIRPFRRGRRHDAGNGIVPEGGCRAVVCRHDFRSLTRINRSLSATTLSLQKTAKMQSPNSWKTGSGLALLCLI